MIGCTFVVAVTISKCYSTRVNTLSIFIQSARIVCLCFLCHSRSNTCLCLYSDSHARALLYSKKFCDRICKDQRMFHFWILFIYFYWIPICRFFFDILYIMKRVKQNGYTYCCYCCSKTPTIVWNSTPTGIACVFQSLAPSYSLCTVVCCYDSL